MKLWTVTIAMALCASTAIAEPPKPVPDVIEYGFEDTKVHGGFPTPTVELLTTRSKRDKESLVRVREQFLVELLKSVEQL